MRSRGLRKGLAALLAGVGWLASACAKNPATGERQLVLISESQEIGMGRDASQAVDREMGLYSDPRMQEYVSEIGQRLARASERPDLPWQFQIVDSTAVNAFALPGGFIYLTRGILAYMESEAAMVGILGHEIGHVTARHSVEQISRSQLAGLGMGLGMVFLPEVRPFGDLLQTSLGLMFLKFSRDDERQADALGVRYALAAGYDPREMAKFFEVLARLGERSGQSLPSWLSTHPNPEDREARILELTREASSSGSLAVREAELLRRIDGLIYGENPREGFMDGSRFKHPDLEFQIDLPPEWKVQNTKQVVYAAEPAGNAALQLSGSRVEAGTPPENYAVRFFRENGVEYGTGEIARFGGFPAYHAPYRARTSGGVIVGEAGFVIDRSMAYAILGMTREGSYDRYRALFVKVMSSFERLRDPAALNVRPWRISIFKASADMTLREALSRTGVENERLEELALVNNRRLDDRIEAGTLLKTLEREASGTGSGRP